VPGEILGIDRQVVGGDFVSEFFGKTAMAIRRRMGPVRARHGLGPGTGAAERVLRHVSHHVVDARGLPSQAFSLGFLRFLEAKWRWDACLSKRKRVHTNLDRGDRSHPRGMRTRDLPLVAMTGSARDAGRYGMLLCTSNGTTSPQSRVKKGCLPAGQVNEYPCSIQRRPMLSTARESASMYG
jgi:hypothetical protein